MNAKLKATFPEDPKPAQDTTQKELEAEAERATKLVLQEKKTGTKAQKTANKLKPSVDAQETQIGRIKNLIAKAQPGSSQAQALSAIKDQEEDDFTDMKEKYRKLT